MNVLVTVHVGPAVTCVCVCVLFIEESTGGCERGINVRACSLRVENKYGIVWGTKPGSTEFQCHTSVESNVLFWESLAARWRIDPHLALDNYCTGKCLTFWQLLS